MKAFLLALAGLAIATAFWHRLAPDVSLGASAFTANGELVTSYLHSGIRTQFSDDDKATDVLAINEAERREGSDETALNGIQFFSESRDGSQWHIDSHSGLFFEDANELFLQDGVRIFEATRKGTINTESMWLLIDKKRAIGSRDVILTNPDSRTVGTGFELDLVTDIATLRGRVKTDYE